MYCVMAQGLLVDFSAVDCMKIPQLLSMEIW